MIQNGAAVFAPTDGTWTVTGKLVDGTVDASRARPTSDRKIYATALKVSVTETKAVGTFTDPSCTYSVDLTRY